MNVDALGDARHVGPLARRERRDLHGRSRCRVSVEGDALTLTGAVNADRGEYTYLSRRFQITRGSALFIGTPDLNPTLQVTAEYQVKTGGERDEHPGARRRHAAEAAHLAGERRAAAALAERPAELPRVRRRARARCCSSAAGSDRGIQGQNVLNLAGARLAGVALGVALDELEGQAARSLGVDVLNITPGDFPAFQVERRSTSSCAARRSRRGAT